MRSSRGKILRMRLARWTGEPYSPNPFIKSCIGGIPLGDALGEPPPIIPPIRPMMAPICASSPSPPPAPPPPPPICVGRCDPGLPAAPALATVVEGAGTHGTAGAGGGTAASAAAAAAAEAEAEAVAALALARAAAESTAALRARSLITT